VGELGAGHRCRSGTCTAALSKPPASLPASRRHTPYRSALFRTAAGIDPGGSSRPRRMGAGARAATRCRGC
jgi:hypothetical protein